MLPFAPSTYHAHVARRLDPSKFSARALRDEVLRPEIERVFVENFEVYGVRKVWRQMMREGFDVARCIVDWRVSRTAHASFVLDALEQALHERRPAHRKLLGSGVATTD